MEIVLCSFEFVIRINEKTSRKDKKSLITVLKPIPCQSRITSIVQL